VQSVLGVDVSENEVLEARRRFKGAQSKRGRGRGGSGGRAKQYSFEHNQRLGADRMGWGREFAAVSCQFAVHYFFESEATLRCLLGNVSAALEAGGRFYGTVPSANEVIDLLDGGREYRSELLHVAATWPYTADTATAAAVAADTGSGGSGGVSGPGPGPAGVAVAEFGAGYTFAIAQTVTNSDGGSAVANDGAEEYLVFFGTFMRVAAEFGLLPDPSFDWDAAFPGAAGLSKAGGSDGRGGCGQVFRLFAPQYSTGNPDSDELAKISRLYAAFVFVKQPRGSRPTDDGDAGSGEDGDGEDGSPGSEDGSPRSPSPIVLLGEPPSLD